MRRSDIERATQAPISIRLGKTTYKLPVLSMEDAAAWKDTMAEEFNKVGQIYQQPEGEVGETVTPASLGVALRNLIFSMPVIVLRVLRAYDTSGVIPAQVTLNGEQVNLEKVISEEQVSEAFETLMEVAVLPSMSSIGKAASALKVASLFQ